MQITLKENCGNTKNISFQFHYRKFSQQSYSTISYYYRHVTKGKRWGRSPLSFLKNWKKVPWFWGKLPIYGLFFQDLFFLCCRWNVYQNALIPRKLPCSHKFLLNGLSTGDSAKKSIHKFFGTALKKNHEHATCIEFQFHNLKLSQKGILDFHVTTATVVLCMKQVIDNSLRRAL